MAPRYFPKLIQTNSALYIPQLKYVAQCLSIEVEHMRVFAVLLLRCITKIYSPSLLVL